MKQGDVGTELVFILRDQDGNPLDLTTAAKVWLTMSLAGRKVERECQIIDAAQGRVRYTVGPDDLTLAGTLLMELRIEYTDGSRYTTTRVVEVVEPRL